MPESRDRLVRPLDIAAVFARRRNEILTDEEHDLFASPIQRRLTDGQTGAGVAATRVGGLSRSSFGTPRSALTRGRYLYRSPAASGRENTPFTGSARRGRGQTSRSVLPSWYPRTPLRDITAIVRAIERRRARVGEGEGQINESPMSYTERGHPDTLPSSACLEHDFRTPAPTARMKTCPPSMVKVSKILLDVTSQNTEESDFLTPQIKLLNSIDTVEKVVTKELQRMKRTPTAKRAEREKRVRTLMSMR